MSRHEKPSFVYATHIAAAPEKLWHALTDGPLTRQYWYGRRVDWKVESTVKFWYQAEGGEAVSDCGIVEGRSGAYGAAGAARTCGQQPIKRASRRLGRPLRAALGRSGGSGSTSPRGRDLHEF